MSGVVKLSRCACRFGNVSNNTWNIVNRSQNLHIRQLSHNGAVEKRNHLFTLEKKKQSEDVGRIEKIEVIYKGVPKDTPLVMNKNISTPFDCARHLSAMHMERSALALIDGNTVWDMHRPLPDNCSLELLHYTVSDPHQVNKAFWRTCSFILGASMMRAFKDNYQVKLHSFPSPDIRSGSFVYDMELCGLAEWKPKEDELRVLSAEFIKFTRSAFKLERLTVSKELALLMFEDNEHKSNQIPDIAKKNEGNITLYRAGNHVDISKGPMISNVSQIGRVTVSAVHQLSGLGGEVLHRFQGVALPVGIVINHVAYNILEDRAKKLNPARSPFGDDHEDSRISHAIA